METAPIVIRWTGMRCAESSIKRKPGLRLSVAAIEGIEKGTFRRNELRLEDFLSCFG